MKNLNLKELTGKTFLEGVKFLGVKKEEFDYVEDNDIMCNNLPNRVPELDYIYTQIDCFDEEEKFLICFILNDFIDTEMNDIYTQEGYWTFNEY